MPLLFGSATLSSLQDLKDGMSITVAFLVWKEINVFLFKFKKLIDFFSGSEQLRELFGRPFNDEGGILDQYIAGFLNQMPHSVDEAITEEVSWLKLIDCNQ